MWQLALVLLLLLLLQTGIDINHNDEYCWLHFNVRFRSTYWLVICYRSIKAIYRSNFTTFDSYFPAVCATNFSCDLIALQTLNYMLYNSTLELYKELTVAVSRLSSFTSYLSYTQLLNFSMRLSSRSISTYQIEWLMPLPPLQCTDRTVRYGI